MCILLNYGGRNFAEHARLPLWLDSFGTVLCAYVGGPVCGAITGVSVNLIYGMINHVSYVYSVTSIALALITGLAARKGKLEYFFGPPCPLSAPQNRTAGYSRQNRAAGYGQQSRKPVLFLRHHNRNTRPSAPWCLRHHSPGSREHHCERSEYAFH